MIVAGETVRRGGTTDRLTMLLRQAIVDLELAPGATIDREAISERYGVSRFPVAEALKRLEAEKLVEIRPQSGSRVSPIRMEDARESLFLRRALEAEVVEALCAADPAPFLDALDRNLRYQKAAAEAGDRAGFHDLDLAFHDMLVSALPYPRIRAAIEGARLALDRARRLLTGPRRHALTFEEHAAIVEALRGRDGPAARAAMAAHMDAVMEELRLFAQAHPEAFAS